MIADIADALLPVFFVMALGFLAGKRRTIDNLNVGSINSLVMTFAIPIALFTTLAGTKRGVIGENASLGRSVRPRRCGSRFGHRSCRWRRRFGAAIAVLVHVPVAYAHVAILILAIPGGFFGVLSGIPYNARSQVASSTLMLSSVGSIVAIPMAILLLQAT
jgi:predicted permease